MGKTTVAESIIKAAHCYCRNIDWVMENNPGDTGELACLYAGISGINECIKTLSEDGLLTDIEKKSLDREMNELFAHCRIRKTS